LLKVNGDTPGTVQIILETLWVHFPMFLQNTAGTAHISRDVATPGWLSPTRRCRQWRILCTMYIFFQCGSLNALTISPEHV
jgi:hypothetical protein